MPPSCNWTALKRKIPLGTVFISGSNVKCNVFQNFISTETGIKLSTTVSVHFLLVVSEFHP